MLEPGKLVGQVWGGRMKLRLSGDGARFIAAGVPRALALEVLKLIIPRAFPLAVLFAALSGCEQIWPKTAEKKAPTIPPPVPVEVARAERSDVDVSVTAIGWVEPYTTVTIKPQVDGELKEVLFREGDDVQAGQVLFRIDARSYEAALHAAEANLIRDQALAQDARREANRMQDLFSRDQGSSRERDQALADAESKESQVKADAAEIERQRLLVERCEIRSPISGRAGTILTHRGNLVKESETQLVVINQITPAYVTFSVPERNLAQIRGADQRLNVNATLADMPEAEVGTLTFIDNQVDRSTGMVKLKATFENKGRRLWPGQFVDAKLTTHRLSQVVVVPATAVQAGQSRTYVFVVKDDMAAEPRTVETGLNLEGRTVITSGLNGNEVVVTDGQLRIAPGSKVQFKTALTSAPSSAPTPEVAHP